MSAFYSDDWLTVYGGDCREVMATMEPESVHCVVTSPPYWGLRDYGTPGQLGLEPSPEEYVAGLVKVFAEVKRVLRKDGTVWLNLGDSYTSGGRQTRDPGQSKIHPALEHWQGGRPGNPDGLKDKDLVGIPWRVAFALQANGWYLRSDIIWAKPNPMPESVTDRPTKAHEYLFLLSKSPRYYFDAEAVAEPVTLTTLDKLGQAGLAGQNGSSRVPGKTNGNMKAVPPRFGGSKYGDDNAEMHRTKSGNEYASETGRRNIRSVWTVATQPYPGAHFAVFPEKLVEPCILAGTSERGVCPECGAPWFREITRGETTGRTAENGLGNGELGSGARFGDSHRSTAGWAPPDCGHQDHYTGLHELPTGAVVLDPFAGSGTVGRVANRLSRRAVLIDLNPDYLTQQMARNRDIPLGLGA